MYLSRDEKIVALGIGALIAGIIWFAVWETRRWGRYAAAHHCRPIDHYTDWSYMTVQCGKDCWTMQAYPVDHTVYRCDGGEVVTR